MVEKKRIHLFILLMYILEFTRVILLLNYVLFFLNLKPYLIKQI